MPASKRGDEPEVARLMSRLTQTEVEIEAANHSYRPKQSFAREQCRIRIHVQCNTQLSQLERQAYTPEMAAVSARSVAHDRPFWLHYEAVQKSSCLT